VPSSEPLPFDPIAEAARQWEAHRGAEPVAAMTAVTSIMRVQQILLARLNALLKPWGLSFPRYEALMLLLYSRRGSLPLGKMGARLQVHPTSVTSLIDGLEAMGLARREPHEHDRRTTLASLTPEGRRVAEEATAALHEARFGLDGLDDDQLAEVSAQLDHLRERAGDFAPATGAPTGS
jgi:DNA-binding MarR family transcriptional regulator